MTDEERSEEILALLRAVRSKRPKVVIEHILQHGYITTEELKTEYGYNHPPRAARDVREQGIPLETFHVVDTTGRTIAAYRFGDLSQIETGRLGGRKAFSKLFKDLLVHNHGAICSVCHTPYELPYAVRVSLSPNRSSRALSGHRRFGYSGERAECLHASVRFL